MSPKTSDIAYGVSPPLTEAPSAQSPPRRIPDRVFLPEETHELFQTGHYTAPDLIYARGVPASLSTDPILFDKTQCTVILIEIGLCRDFGCDIKIEKKIEKYSPLIAALKRY